MDTNAQFSQEQIALLQTFFEGNHAQCYWSWNPKVVVTSENAQRVLKTARTFGGREGYDLARQINELSPTK